LDGYKLPQTEEAARLKLVLIQDKTLALYHGRVQKGVWILDPEEDPAPLAEIVEEIRNAKVD
jgi:hypothetical protein